MRRLILSTLAGCVFSWFGSGLTWSLGERLPHPLQWIAFAFAPGYGLARLLERFLEREASIWSDLLVWGAFYAGNAAVWAIVFYALATLYVRVRRAQVRG